jgi:hypothetical protein
VRASEIRRAQGQHPKGTVFAVVLCVLIALVLTGFAGAEGPETVPISNIEFTFNADFSPKVLSKTVPTPIALKLSGQVKTVDGTHPPALREFILDADKSGAIDVRGLPVCHPTIEIPMMERCRSTTVGRGTMNVEIEFPDSAPFLVESELTVSTEASNTG